ncbi:MAG: prephenate dehydratase domain-containing protein [Clostridia bacterium]|nr:prephenate dehydratase domain-containing protein [Clostridia bacterium]
MDIREARNQIDSIDNELIRLFSERMNLAAEISRYKKEHNMPVLDAGRERVIIQKVIERTPEELRDYSPLLYSLILELSKSYQKRLIGLDTALIHDIRTAVEETPQLFPEHADVAVQGIAGANSQLACDRMFRYANINFFSSFGEVFDAIENGTCRYGIVPLENSTAGSVNAVYDLMSSRNLKIVRSLRLKVRHNLLVKPGTKLEGIHTIYSHEQAIAQCSEFLSTLEGVRVIPVANTAIAAKMVSESDRSDIAALATEECVRFYGLENIKPDVQNVGNNYTRFICISKDLEIYPGANRTSVIMTLHHDPGSLYKMLSRFYAYGINLTKLESRPIPDREFEFKFYFDLDCPIYATNLVQLIGELPSACEEFRYLGTYSETL